MSGRPGEWHLLGHGSDPVPGDAHEVDTEASHYRTVAATITDQIARLRQLAAPDAALKGHYADALQDGMRELADDLDKIENRFTVVASQLTRLAPELRDAMRTTSQALHDAVEAQRQIDANQPAGPRPPGSPEPTPEQKDAAEARGRRHEAGMDALAAARTKCDTAISDYDHVADDVARKIRDASDDDMKDSRWDRFKDFVHSISTQLDFLADLLGWIATALTVLALFIPGLNLLVIALILMVGALLIHTLLATTGNGSWVDVAFDVLALATLGMSQRALAVAKMGRAATLANAGRMSGRAASQGALARASFNGGRGFVGTTHKTFLRLFSGSTRASMRSAYDDAFLAMTKRELPATTLRQRFVAALDDDIAAMRLEMGTLRREFGERVIDPRYAEGIARMTRWGWTAVGTDVGQKGLEGIKLGENHVYQVPAYNDFKDRFVPTYGGPL